MSNKVAYSHWPESDLVERKNTDYKPGILGASMKLHIFSYSLDYIS